MLDTHELQRRPGTMREFARVVPAPADLGTAVIGIPEGADLTVGLRLEAVMEACWSPASFAGRRSGSACGALTR